MRTIVLLPELPAALPYCRSQIGHNGARRHPQSNQQIEPATAMAVEHCDHHRMLVRAGSPVIGPVKAHHRAISASAKDAMRRTKTASVILHSPSSIMNVKETCKWIMQSLVRQSRLSSPVHWS
jgi:hypothetical protein